MEQLRDEAMIADIDDMKRMRPVKRYALATILIYMKSASAIDDLVQIFIMWIRKIEAQAKSKLEEYRLEQAEKTDEFAVLYNTLLALKNNDTSHEKIRAIEEHLGGKIDELIEQCREHLKLTDDNHITWMQKPYNNKRHVIFQLLENLTVLSSTNDKSIENALKFIMYYRHSHKEWIELDDDPSFIQPDLSLLSEGWFKVCYRIKKDAPIKKINRHYYEMAVLTVLKNDLNCSDAYVDGAFIYDDPNKQFITWEQFEEEVDAYCDLVKLPKESGKFIASKQINYNKQQKMLMKIIMIILILVIDNGLPILKKLPKKKEHPDLDKIKQMIMDEMPIKSIVDVIVEAENWLNLSVHFKPLSGYETKIARLSITICCNIIVLWLQYGSNTNRTFSIKIYSQTNSMAL